MKLLLKSIGTEMSFINKSMREHPAGAEHKMTFLHHYTSAAISTSQLITTGRMCEGFYF